MGVLQQCGNRPWAMRVPMDGSSQPALVPGTVVPHAIIASRTHLAVSPDGKYLAFVITTNADG